MEPINVEKHKWFQMKILGTLILRFLNNILKPNSTDGH